MKKTPISENEVLATTLLLNRKSKQRIDSIKETQKALMERINDYPVQGPRGDQGLPGRTGDIGPIGPPGMPGRPGDKGEKGDPGPEGKAGPEGTQGPPGAIGATGLTGPQGEKGEQGIQGIPGAHGPQGEQGIQGPKGDRGEKGDKGDTGLQGLQGIPGQKGAKGDKGEKGAKGNKGVRGLRGFKGDKGDIGPTGPIGEKGAPGEPGPKGIDADVEEPMHKINHEFGQLRNKLITHINSALTNIAMSSGGGGSSGGGSVNILDNDDVIFERLENMLNNSVLVFDTSVKKFKAVSIVDLINEVKSELEFKYTKLIDKVGDITYIGEADPGSAEGSSVWRIFRLDETADPDLEIKWANGAADFDKVWTDRATYTYS